MKKSIILIFTLILFLPIIFSNCKEEEPVALFSIDKENAVVDEEISLQNESTFASSFNWDFGDGTSSTIENPKHSYNQAGLYTITLSATGEGGTSSTSKDIVIDYPEPIANFSIDITNPQPNEEINFINSSEFASSFSWDFGDGSTSNEENPKHSFSELGDYIVMLSASGDGGTNSVSKTINISYRLPQASFSMDISEAGTGDTIIFNNLSKNATSFSWDFGDGTTSNEENPKHVFLSAGNFNVKLNAEGLGGNDEFSQTIDVKGNVSGKWVGSISSPKVSVLYDITENKGEISGWMTVLYSFGMMAYTTNGSYNDSNGEVYLQAKAVNNANFEFSGNFDRKNNITGKLKETGAIKTLNFSSKSITLNRSTD